MRIYKPFIIEQKHEKLVNSSVHGTIILPTGRTHIDNPEYYRMTQQEDSASFLGRTEFTNSYERLLYDHPTPQRELYRLFNDNRNAVVFTQNLDDYMDEEIDRLNMQTYVVSESDIYLDYEDVEVANCC